MTPPSDSARSSDAVPTAEPRPLDGDLLFDEGDFHALKEGLDRDPQFNDRRLQTRRKLLALGKRAVAAIADDGLPLECRTSLHHPHSFNGMRVRRLWAYLIRPKAEKTRLRRVLGAELAKDLDSAYKNAYLCLALEADAIEVSLRIHPEAWYDGQNLSNRLRQEGPGAWLALLNALPGYRLRMHDWKGEWRCGELDALRLEEYLSYWVPGEHRLSIEKRWPAPPGARAHVFTPEAVVEVERAWRALVPAYRYAAWSRESDWLFAK